MSITDAKSLKIEADKIMLTEYPEAVLYEIQQGYSAEKTEFASVESWRFVYTDSGKTLFLIAHRSDKAPYTYSWTEIHGHDNKLWVYDKVDKNSKWNTTDILTAKATK